MYLRDNSVFIVFFFFVQYYFSLPKPEYIRAPGAYRMYNPKVCTPEIAMIITLYTCQ